MLVFFLGGVVGCPPESFQNGLLFNHFPWSIHAFLFGFKVTSEEVVFFDERKFPSEKFSRFVELGFVRICLRFFWRFLFYPLYPWGSFIIKPPFGRICFWNFCSKQQANLRINFMDFLLIDLFGEPVWSG